MQGLGDSAGMRCIPAEVLRLELDGAHPVTAWREHLGMTARDLAARAGVSATYLLGDRDGAQAGVHERIPGAFKRAGRSDRLPRAGRLTLDLAARRTCVGRNLPQDSLGIAVRTRSRTDSRD